MIDNAGYEVEEWRFKSTKRDYEDVKDALDFYKRVSLMYGIEKSEIDYLFGMVKERFDSCFMGGVYYACENTSFGFDRSLSRMEIDSMLKVEGSFVYYSVHRRSMIDAIIYFERLLKDKRHEYISKLESEYLKESPDNEEG